MCLTLWSLLQWLYEIIEAETCYLWLYAPSYCRFLGTSRFHGKANTIVKHNCHTCLRVHHPTPVLLPLGKEGYL